MREAPKKDHVSQEPIHNHTTNPITEGVNTDEDLPPFIETTLDGLASISSKISPIAQKFGKGVGRFRQYAEEKMGTAEDITVLPQEYRDLEKRVDVLAQLHQNFLRVVKTYNTPAYDYPLQFQESLLGFTSTVTNQIQQLSKSVSERAQTEPPAIPTVSKPDHPKSLYHAIGRVSLKGAEDVGKEEALGAALDKFGTVSDRLGNARLTMDHEIVSKFNKPLQVNLKTSIEMAMKARRNVQDKRLALDAAKTHYRESNRGNLDSARLEVEQAEDQFVGAVEEATHAMKVVLEDPEPLRDLADFAQIQLSFFKEAQDLLSGLVPQLEEYRATQETIYRGVENSE
ncbi:Bin/amphiphysin/Rvs domain for vesicular trafficking-domain-containing protein [Pilaira anomala]|nr:Bin/amphiphysin/Rvs domain for vesicular trafficking-domain-containing protein [Pilaira anomala]